MPACVQGDSEGKEGGDRLSHCEKQVPMDMSVTLNSNRDRAAQIYQYKGAVNGKKQREIPDGNYYFYFYFMFEWQVCYTEMTPLLQ
jgi:hypothetical protein